MGCVNEHRKISVNNIFFDFWVIFNKFFHQLFIYLFLRGSETQKGKCKQVKGNVNKH